MSKLIAVVGLLLFAVPSFAQITARHEESSEVQQFDSPMLLDLPFPIQNPELWKKGGTKTFSKDLTRFVCENVSFTSITVQFDKAKNGTVPLNVTAYLKNRPGHDKLVQLRFQVFRDGVAISPGERVLNVDAEEGRAVKVSFRLAVKEEQLRKEGPDPVLNIRLEAKDY
jgi:hypothetical protein